MSEGELIALAAIVMQEAVCMAGENQQRASLGYSAAFVDGSMSGNAILLEEELKKKREERREKNVIKETNS